MDFFKKINFLTTFKHYKINKNLIKDSSKLDETDCVLCFTAITCLSNPIIYCSKCERGAHRVCLRLSSVPSEDFFCVTCSEELNKKNIKHEKEVKLPVICKLSTTNWMNNYKLQEFSLNKSRRHREQKYQILVDREILIMKNRNPASRTEDINRVLSSKINIKFDGKLKKLSEYWAFLEISQKLLLLTVYSLIKANIKTRMYNDNNLGLVFDLERNKLFVNNKSQQNKIILPFDKKYPFEDWIYNSKSCIKSKFKFEENQYSQEPKFKIKMKDDSNWKKKLHKEPTIDFQKDEIADQKKKDRERLKIINDVISDGMSDKVKRKKQSQDFQVFCCKSMMILKKFLDDDKNLKKCIKGDLNHIQKMNKEIKNEIKRAVQIFKNCQVDNDSRDNSANKFENIEIKTENNNEKKSILEKRGNMILSKIVKKKIKKVK